MGKLIVMNQITVNGAFEAPTPDAVRLELVASTPYRSGVVWLRYRPAAG
jgi:hypothetical protein